MNDEELCPCCGQAKTHDEEYDYGSIGPASTVRPAMTETDMREAFDTILADGWPIEDHWHGSDMRIRLDQTHPWVNTMRRLGAPVEHVTRTQELLCQVCGDSWTRKRRVDDKGWKKAQKHRRLMMAWSD